MLVFCCPAGQAHGITALSRQHVRNVTPQGRCLTQPCVITWYVRRSLQAKEGFRVLARLSADRVGNHFRSGEAQGAKNHTTVSRVQGSNLRRAQATVSPICSPNGCAVAGALAEVYRADGCASGVDMRLAERQPRRQHPETRSRKAAPRSTKTQVAKPTGHWAKTAAK